MCVLPPRRPGSPPAALRPGALLLALAALAPALPARAHETLHEVHRGRAVAVRAYESDGEALAGAPFEVYAPADPRVPWLTGRTDRDGWLAFVPSAPGAWRVRVIEEGGHGLDLRVDAAPPAAAPGAPAPAGPSTTAFVLRPVAGLLAVGAVFAALLLAYRRRGGAR